MLELFALLSLGMAKTTASSSAKVEELSRPASNAVDGLLQTAWAAESSEENPWWELDLGKTTSFQSISIWPGDLTKGVQSYTGAARPKIIRISVDGKVHGDSIRVLDKPVRVDIPLEAKGRRIRITVEESYEGILYSQTFITEVAVDFPKRDKLARFDKWTEGKEAKRLHEAFKNEVEENFLVYKEAQFGDRDALAFICDTSADGPSHIRKRAMSMVGEGYRAQAIIPPEIALEALRKLQDANAIPYLELAALRATGKAAKKRWSDVGYFYALQKLIGGANRNVKNWGEAGWSKGEIQSFGEPLPIEMDRFGNILLADSGNNRLQIFDEKGKAAKQIGGEKAEITNLWLNERNRWYVSGASPGNKGGLFINPLDVELIPGKEVDELVVLDADGRIQVFSSEGEPLRSWKARPATAAEAKMGGTAFLAYLPRKKIICAIIQDQGSCYTLDAEEISRWEIPDGTPTAVEVYKGKMLLSFNDQVISYSHDGFRHQILIDKGILGDGFEYLDMTLDENGKLWILTDIGTAFKFKKPGKIEYQIQAIDRPLSHPRIALYDEILYLSGDDRIEVHDIRQLRIDQEEESEK
jgi:hypothetical protein